MNPFQAEILPASETRTITAALYDATSTDIQKNFLLPAAISTITLQSVRQSDGNVIGPNSLVVANCFLNVPLLIDGILRNFRVTVSDSYLPQPVTGLNFETYRLTIVLTSTNGQTGVLIIDQPVYSR